MNIIVANPIAHQQPQLAKPRRTTFVLPGRNRSGGVRVTVEMAVRLQEQNYNVRIVYRRPLIHGLRTKAMRIARMMAKKISGVENDDWLPNFKGQVAAFGNLSDLSYEQDEVVIAVGSMVVPEVRELKAPVKCVRFCHGFHNFDADRMRAAWTGQMPTMTVSKTLIPGLRMYSPMSNVWWVPNGIDTNVYMNAHGPRDGVGTIYSVHEAKNPRDILQVMMRLPGRLPLAKRYIFGTPARPSEIPKESYDQLPSMERAVTLYNKSKIWLLMSQAEGLPGPVLEAMSCGAVVITSDNEGSLEVVRNEYNGLTFRVGDIDGCLEAVDRVWNDDALRLKLATAGLDTAQVFSWDRATRRMQECLSDLAKSETLYQIT